MSDASRPEAVTGELDQRLATLLAKPGSRELLAALQRHPGQAAGAYWSAAGVPLREGTLRSRLTTFRRHGLVEVGRTALTEHGRQVLEGPEVFPLADANAQRRRRPAAGGRQPVAAMTRPVQHRELTLPDPAILAVVEALARRQARLDYAAAQASGSAPMTSPTRIPADQAQPTQR